MKSRYEIIKNVIDDFLGENLYQDEAYDDSFMGLVLDDDEREILAKAINEALEQNENKN